MTTKIIQVGGYRVGYDPAYSPEEKAVGIIFSAYAKSGMVTVVSFPLEKGLEIPRRNPPRHL